MTMKAISSILENFINGNLSDAKRKAKPSRITLRILSDTLQSDYGYSEHKAIMTAYYLKGQCSLEEACNA